ncbi:hypothetical protein BC835DRAFT_1395355 [Cytidiella melzeri]|nr:hypothetical protein BC835DRAFT_1395355 [Cytidiella melzeri]
MDIDERQSTSRPPSPSHQTQYALQPTNALAGPSTIPEQPPIPPIYLPPLPGLCFSFVYVRYDADTVARPFLLSLAGVERPKPRPYFDSTQDLLSRFELLAAYDKYVRPHSLPVGATGGNQESMLSAADKGKGKELEMPPRDVPSPTPQTPGAGADGDDEETQGKGEKKWKTNYKHLIKCVPGKHSMKKDDYLMTTMQVPPKQRIAIIPFDLRTQRDAFSVSLEGLKGWNINVLVAESPQAREDRKRRKELKKLAKQGALATGTSPAVPPVTPALTAVSTPGAAPAARPTQTLSGIPRSGNQLSSKATAAALSQPPQQSTSQPTGITPTGVGTPHPMPTSASAILGSGRHTPMPTPAPTPAGQAFGTGDMKRGIKREREDSVSLVNGSAAIAPTAAAPGVTVSTNGPVKVPASVMNAKAGSGGVRSRPVKRQRVDMQGQAREVPLQQPTPHA